MFLNKISAIFILLCLFFISACGGGEASNTSDTPATPNEPTKVADYKALAKVFCDCAQPSIELNQKMAKLQEEGKREEFVAMAEQVGEKFKAAMSCARENKEQYTSAVLNPEETFKAMMTNCPNIPERLADNLSKVVK